MFWCVFLPQGCVDCLPLYLTETPFMCLLSDRLNAQLLSPPLHAPPLPPPQLQLFFSLVATFHIWTQSFCFSLVIVGKQRALAAVREVRPSRRNISTCNESPEAPVPTPPLVSNNGKKTSPNIYVVFTVRRTSSGDTERMGRKKKRCVFPQRDRKPRCGITGSQRIMGGSGQRNQNMEPSGRSLWSALETESMAKADVVRCGSCSSVFFFNSFTS